MTERNNNNEGTLRSKISRFFHKHSPAEQAEQAEQEFSHFKLVTVPDTKNIAPTAFNDSVSLGVAESVKEDVQREGSISSLEVYLTRNTLDRLSVDIRIDRTFRDLLDMIRKRVGEMSGAREPDVSWNERGIPVTPALEGLFDECFIVRPIFPPQVYAPFDESNIAINIDQILIGMVKVEDATGRDLGETPIRALLIEGGDREGVQRLEVHADFDLLLKAFYDEPVAHYPLGICIRCTLMTDDDLRRVSDVSLDIHDTRALAGQAEGGEEINLSYTLIEGGAQRTNINDYPDDIYRVPAEHPPEQCKIAENTYIPVDRKVGLEVTLRYKNRAGKTEAAVYRYLFRFFKYAPRFVPSSNRMVATGQFIRKSDVTTLMLPPFQNSNGKENQTPVMTITPEDGTANSYVLTLAQESPVRLSINGNQVMPGTKISLNEPVEILGESGHEGDSDHEKFKFVLYPLSMLSAGRQRVAQKKEPDGYVAFAEVSSGRSILLSRREIKLGRNRLLYKETPISMDALTLKRKYVIWEAIAKTEEHILYYSMAQGQVAQEVTELSGPVGLGLMGTYYLYVGDNEFTLSLEATQRTELNMMQLREEQGRS